MKIRIIDYVANPGGGLRFTLQLLRAFEAFRFSIEVVSYGPALLRYERMVREAGLNLTVTACPPDRPERGSRFHGHHVSEGAVSGCDIAWFPWIHLHRISQGAARHVVGSFHDGLLFTESTLYGAYPALGNEEMETVRRWLDSPATLVCSANFWRRRLAEIFSCGEQRLSVIPLSGRHAPGGGKATISPRSAPWLARPYFLCPSNTTPHKNHEVLFRGYAESGVAWPLTLTGSGTSLNDEKPLRAMLRRLAGKLLKRYGKGRAADLRQLTERLRLKRGTSLNALGLISDADYETILTHAACLIMPTRGEGGGSFPVEEALIRGVPVISSDIPVIREQVSRLNGEVLWFDPTDHRALSRAIHKIVNEYPNMKLRALSQVAQLSPRDWRDVAAEYAAVFRRVHAGAIASVALGS